MNSKVLQLLEYNKIIDLLSAQAGSALSRERISRFTPMSNERMIREALTETTEAVSVILYKGSVPVGEIGDINGLLTMVRKGRSLSMRELLMVRRSLAGAREVHTFLASDVPEIPVMTEINDLIVEVPKLERDIERCILSDDQMADNASPALKKIRRDIRNKNEAIKGRLSKFTAGGGQKKYLQDAIVTMRNGRYVIPVKREYSSLVPGLVHDQSQTGATLFIEPQAIVNMNNELRELELQERDEIERILRELSDRVGEHYHELKNNQELMIKLDIINAKGRLSCMMDGSAPHLNTEGRLEIHGGRHPLIPADKVVPINVALGRDYQTLLITGPNTGGKTVTLKTIGLFILMAESGLHVPCYESSEIPVLDEVYADIGDEQSIEQNLSTFSSHMVNIADIFRHANEHSLVLLDEVAAGTDPAEGAALGIAMLEKLHEQGALVCATTHYTELKKYALSTEGVENASMEFDVETLSPTYHLRIGLPGKSNAFEISRKLGLETEIIDHAAELMGQNQLEFENAVSRVEEEKKRTEEALREAQEIRREAEEKLRKAGEKLSAAEDSRAKILEQAHQDAREIVRDAHATVDEVSRELREAAKAGSRGKEVAAVADSRRKLRETEGKHRQNKPEKKNNNIPKPEQLKPGVRIKHLKLNQNGEVQTAPDDRGNLQVQVGALKMKANIKDLMIIESERAGNKERKRREYSKYTASKAKTISTEIKVIGMNLDDATMAVEKYIDDAWLSGLKQVRVIHGRGTGILRDGLRRDLKRNKHVKSIAGAPYDQGGEGATIVKLKDR